MNENIRNNQESYTNDAGVWHNDPKDKERQVQSFKVLNVR